jgi:hypothetical protein
VTVPHYSLFAEKSHFFNSPPVPIKPGMANPEQRSELAWLAEYGQQFGIEVRVLEMK